MRVLALVTIQLNPCLFGDWASWITAGLSKPRAKLPSCRVLESLPQSCWLLSPSTGTRLSCSPFSVSLSQMQWKVCGFLGENFQVLSLTGEGVPWPPPPTHLTFAPWAPRSCRADLGELQGRFEIRISFSAIETPHLEETQETLGLGGHHPCWEADIKGKQGPTLTQVMQTAVLGWEQTPAVVESTGTDKNFDSSFWHMVFVLIPSWLCF